MAVSQQNICNIPNKLGLCGMYILSIFAE